MLYTELTGKILEACFEVSNELGVGYIESAYEKALQVALLQKDISVERQISLQVNFRGVTVGDFTADMIIEEKVLLELKVTDVLTNQHFAQLLNYLKAIGIRVGIAINFGTPKIQFRRFDNRFYGDLNMDKALRDLIEE